MTADDSTFEALGGWPGVLGRLLAGRDLTGDEAAAALGQVLDGEASPAQIAAFVTALRMKGETVGEMTGLVEAMLAHAERVEIGGDVVDTCGTGGDRRGTVNVSTMAAFVVAGGGAKVCKHGGRAASSLAGSADVLEALGVVIDLGPSGVARCIEVAGMGFCFAPRFHPAMRHAAPVRRELGVPTVFNFLGPLANPARARFQVVGVGDPAMVRTMAGALAAGGTRRAMVVHADDGLDELSTTEVSTVLDVVAGEGGGAEVHELRIDARDYGLQRATVAELRGGDADANAGLLRRVLDGEPGPRRDIVVLNAAAGLLVAGKVPDMAAGVGLAQEVLDDGRAARVLDLLVETSKEEAAR